MLVSTIFNKLWEENFEKRWIIMMRILSDVSYVCYSCGELPELYIYMNVLDDNLHIKGTKDEFIGIILLALNLFMDEWTNLIVGPSMKLK